MEGGCVMAADVESECGGPSGCLLVKPVGLELLTMPAVMLARLGLVGVCCTPLSLLTVRGWEGWG